ncbi:hypothetical protein GGI07_001463 [Coemansia sp. Benny D115]|nr:hypothetical protein GGI07_001463 [Coemansia sp. Benny D115]
MLISKCNAAAIKPPQPLSSTAISDTSVSSTIPAAVVVPTSNAVTTERLPEGNNVLVASPAEDASFALFAAYAGAAYTVTNRWDCPYACQYPGTQDTVIEYNWEVGFPTSAGYIARNPQQRILVVAFQGTNDVSQWVENFDIAQEQWPESISGSRVHRGFLRGYESVRDQVLDNINRLAAEYPEYTIALVGHSLGGARAALCLLDLSIQYPELLPRLGLYTQGQPRTGNKAFANAIDSLKVPKYREVYEYDIAPHVPLVAMGYFHHMSEVWIHNNQTIICTSPTRADGCASDGDSAHTLNVDDHFGYPGLRYK